jgi:hypothetical protein
MVMKVSTLLLCLAPFVIYAQPTETDIKKQLTNSNTIEIKFTKSTGTRQWNSGTGNYEYVRGVIMKQKSFEYPEYKVIIGGDAVYQQISGGKYSYWKFRSLYKTFEGIPNPLPADVIKVLEKDWKKFYGYGFNKIIKLHSQPQLSTEPEWIWHTPKSVSFKMNYRVDMITSNIHVETGTIESEVRLYRDDVKGEWESFFVLNAPLKATEKKEYSRAEIIKFEKTTLAYTLNEQQAQKNAASLPKIDVPDFNTPQELADYIHDILLNGNPEQLKAVLMKTLAPEIFFVPGSSAQLTDGAKMNIDECIKRAYQSPLKYKDQYCVNYKKGSLTSTQHIYILGNLPKTTTLISMIKAKVGYINGVAQTKWKISNLDITVRQDEDAEQYLNSFADKSKLCNN